MTSRQRRPTLVTADSDCMEGGVPYLAFWFRFFACVVLPVSGNPHNVAAPTFTVDLSRAATADTGERPETGGDR